MMVPIVAKMPLNAIIGFLPNLSVSQPAGREEMRIATPTNMVSIADGPAAAVPCISGKRSWIKYKVKPAIFVAPTRNAKRLMTHQTKDGDFFTSFPSPMFRLIQTPTATATAIPSTPMKAINTRDAMPLRSLVRLINQRTRAPVPKMTTVKAAVMAAKRPRDAQSMS